MIKTPPGGSFALCTCSLLCLPVLAGLLSSALAASSASSVQGALGSARMSAPERRADELRANSAMPRLEYSLNEGWRFAPVERPGAEHPGYDDSGWEVASLPHTWNAQDGLDDAEGYRRGVGWYRRVVHLPAGLQGRRVFFRFEGANQVADVWVNGRQAGRHVGGYTAFAFDVTDLVSFESANLLAVRVDNSHDPDVPPLDADFTFYGGLYRDVWLVATDPLHVDVLDHASAGVFVDTPELTRESGLVRVRGALVNHGEVERDVEVVSRIVDASGAPVTALRTRLRVAPSARVGFEQLSEPLERPRLWSPEDPYLYAVHVEVHADGGDPLDAVRVPLGFRRFSADGTSGLSLNGRPLRLYGTNRHQDRAGYGGALPDWAHREDVALIDDTGFNFLRLAHYPQDPAVLEEADRRGLIVWEEIPIVNRVTQSAAFAKNSERMLVEMIRQHYNHPSVLMWGYMNEVLLAEPDPSPEGYRADVLELARRLDARAKAEDPGRLTVMARSWGEVGDDSGLDGVADILGMNLYFGWYYDDFAALGDFLDEQHRRHPDRPLIISEYGAGSDERVHTLEPQRFDFSSEYQQLFHRETFPTLEARPYLVGGAVWNQFDFGSAHRQDTKTGINQKGLFTFDRRAKDVAFYYAARLRDEPVLHIEREWSRRAGSRREDAEQPVCVYSNLEAVEILHDGVSRGTLRIENAQACWSVPLRAGMNRLVARGALGEVQVHDAAVIDYDDRTSFRNDPRSGARTLAINAGAHYQFVDEGGMVWETDRSYEGESWGFVGGRPSRTHHRILGTADDPLYQATREGPAEYRFAVPDGLYEVGLAFVETRYDDAGRRVFGVAVNGRPAVVRIDLAAEHGRYVAVEHRIRVDAVRGQGITVRFEPVSGEPTVSALRVQRI